MRHMRLLEPHPHRPNEPLELWRLPREIVPHERRLRHHPLPLALLPLPRLHHPKHLILRNRLHPRQRHIPLPRLLLPLLLHRIAQHLRPRLHLPIQQIRRHRPLLRVLLLRRAALRVPLGVLADGLLQSGLLLEALLVVDLALDARELGHGGAPAARAGLEFALLLIVVQALAVALLRELDVVALGHGGSRGRGSCVEGGSGS
mmetsp:Transcript_21495/g.52942  ORF Transcript_21495/g.52942 Transcript_21495/m.52942 type:complete len:203 (-) Transcript_21495:16-624(-)